MAGTLPEGRNHAIAHECDHRVVGVVQVLEEDAVDADRAQLLDPLDDILDRAREPPVASLAKDLLGIRVGLRPH